jgi:hypothetical protein
VSLSSVKDLLNPLGTERSFWTAVNDLCEQESPHRWSFETWESVLELARMKGVAAHDERGVFAGPFGVALLTRHRWLKDARKRGLTPRQAEAEFCGRINRERSEERRRQAEMAEQRAREAALRGRKSNREVDL